MASVRTDDGVTIWYETRGEGPRDLLLMHGWAGSGAYWDEMLRNLDLAGLRATTIDLRGHGASDKPPGGFTFERFARDVWAVADDLGARQVVVIGFSMSGKFAQYLPVLQPARVAGQVLVAGCPASPIPFPQEVHRDWVERAGDRERLKEVTRSFLTRPVAAEVLERWADDAVKVPRIALDETLTMCVRHSFAELLPGLPTLTLVVAGIHDAIFSPEALRQGVVAQLARARLAVLDSNHEIPIEAPKELAAVIQAFLAGLG